jgi:hypothetical protein
MGKQRIKPNYRRRVLRLPDLDHCKLAVLNSLGSPASRRVYEYAIDQFHRLVLLRTQTRLQSHRSRSLSDALGSTRSGCKHHQPTTRSRAKTGSRSRRLGLAESRAGCGDQPSERGQAARVSLRQLAELRAKFRSAETCSWRYHACQARLRHAGHAVWVWFSQIRTCGPGVG